MFMVKAAGSTIFNNHDEHHVMIIVNFVQLGFSMKLTHLSPVQY
jgi:hypothetical protein